MNYPMKYTICGFNQQKLFDYNLDINDAQILRWLIDFAATGKMRKLIENNTVYYLVNYEAIICAFPIMGITSTKAISNRFEKYVKCGLLQKTVRKGGSFSGTATLFAITSLVGDMIYDEKNIQIAQESEKIEPPQKSDKNQTSCRKPEDKSVSNSDKNQTSYRDKNQTSCRTGTKLPVALKNSSVNSSDINSSSTQKEDLQVLRKILDEYVDSKSFSEDFVPKLYQKLTEFQIKPVLYQEFIAFAYSECTKKVNDKSKLLSYMYNSICDNYFVSCFLKNKAKQTESAIQREKELIECPVCQTKHNYYDDCPECGLRNIKNPVEVEFFKKIFKLNPEKKNAMEAELRELRKTGRDSFNPAFIMKLKVNEEGIYQKYINISHEEYIKIFG